MGEKSNVVGLPNQVPWNTYFTVDLDIIAEGPHVGNAKTYRLNPYMAHKGRNQKQTIIEYDELKKLRERKAETV